MNYFDIEINGKKYKALKERVGNSTWLSFGGWSFKSDFPFGKRLKTNASGSGLSGNEIRSPMPGQLLKILVKAGDTVTAGDSLAVLEAMKMEHSLKASFDTKVKEVFFKVGDNLQTDDLIISLENPK